MMRHFTAIAFAILVTAQSARAENMITFGDGGAWINTRHIVWVSEVSRDQAKRVSWGNFSLAGGFATDYPIDTKFCRIALSTDRVVTVAFDCADIMEAIEAAKDEEP